jgi:preprotein translocase subunit SecD
VRRRVILLIVTVVAIVGMFTATLVSSSRPVLGLDLQGGISIVLFPVKGSDLSALNTAVDVIRNRINGLGIAEPNVQRQGNTIVVDLPGVKDRAKAEHLVGETAELRFRPVQYSGTQPLIFPFGTSATSTTRKNGATTTTGAHATTSTGHGATTTTRAAQIAGTTVPKSSTSGHAAGGQTIETTPIVARFAATPVTSATTRANTGATAPTTVKVGSGSGPSAGSGLTPTSPKVGSGSGLSAGSGLTPTTIPPTTTTTTPSFPGCAALIKQSPPDTDAAQEVVLPDRLHQSCYVLGPAIVTGKSIGSANTQYDSTSSQWATNVHFRNNDFLTKIAGPYVNKDVAIELDGVVQSAPVINPGITGRDVQITGNFTQGQANALSLVLKYGALPIQFDQAKQTVESVSPTLGRDQLTAGIVSGVIGLILVALYMLLFYRLLGLVVIVGLGLTGMLFFTAVSYLSSAHGLTLTLAGVTGIIVSVGVTVDSYVVYFERLKDEVRTGKTVRSSLEPGFVRSWRTIVAADLVSLIGAGVLYVFATSSVQGFAFFLGLSTAMDLLLAYCFMHPMASVLARRPRLVQLPGVGIAAALDVVGATA